MEESEDKAAIRVDLSDYETPDYDPGSVGKRALWYLTSLVFFETLLPWPSSLKGSLLRAFGAEIGKGVIIKPEMKIKYPWLLSVGDHAWLGEQAWIDNPAPVKIGAHAVLSQRSYVLTGNHDYRAEKFDLKLGPVDIGDGAWVAAQAVIAPGCQVGNEAVIGLGAVLFDDAEANSVYSGNPATRVRERFRS